MIPPSKMRVVGIVRERFYVRSVIKSVTEMKNDTAMTELIFRLEVDDGWPPVMKECLVCTVGPSGYRVDVPPFFIKGLSVGDIISVNCDESGDVLSWSYVDRSGRSTVWIMVFDEYSIAEAAKCLRGLGCNVEELRQLQYFSIDIPEQCSLESFDKCMDAIDEEKVAVAYPSLRHG